MLTDEQLERFARHVSLAEVGEHGQERLLACRVRVSFELPFVGEAFARIGVDLSRSEPFDWDLVAGAEPGLVVAPGIIQVGTMYDESDAQLWLAGLIATELCACVLGIRPTYYKVALAFPTHRVVNEAKAT